MRPPAPVPAIFERSRLFSRAILRTSGDRGPAGVVTDAETGAETAGAGASITGAVATGAAGAASTTGAGAATGALAPSLIRATTVFTPTVWPSGTSTSARTPEAGDGISVSTLSVEISNKGSSRSTVSPAFFSHLVNVPSTMLSPIWGITTSVIAQTLQLKQVPEPASQNQKFCRSGG